MKKIVLIYIIFVFINADIIDVINDIKKMESFTPQFKKLPRYDFFGNYSINKTVKEEFIPRSEKLQINAIFQNRVNINGHWYKTGDSVNGYEIVKINNNEIIMKKNGEIKKLLFKSNIIKVVK